MGCGTLWDVGLWCFVSCGGALRVMPGVAALCGMWRCVEGGRELRLFFQQAFVGKAEVTVVAYNNMV